MKHIVVTECFESIVISDKLNDAALNSVEVDELAAYVRKQELDEDGILISRNEVRFINYVGFIQLSTCSIEILPKVSGSNPRQSRRVLLRMLQCTGFLEIHESQISQLTVEKINLLEIIAYLFVAKLSNELRKGVYRSYQREQDELQLVRGKIDMNRQLRREAMMKPGVSCVYDEFQVTNELNQVLVAGLQTVLSRCSYPATRMRAASSMALLDEVKPGPITQYVMDHMLFDRTNRRFQESYRLAKLLISQTAPMSAPGRSKNSSILFKMNDLFEAYVAYLANKLIDQVTIKDRSHKLLIKEGTTRGVFQLEPDLLIGSSSGAQIIVDTKWKMIRSDRLRHGVKREDFYQMYAYLTRYQEVDTVVILYPHHDGIDEPAGSCLESWHLEGQPSKRLKVYTINYEDERIAELQLQEIIDLIE
ncbi:McrC family protein [Paenibacillus sp. SN-8-1]|uniref:McrC family protein n=1 Tax=Paenibacillus sp. SN-8-1 TaxID=3435409 RepID=UPI003D9A1A11